MAKGRSEHKDHWAQCIHRRHRVPCRTFQSHTKISCTLPTQASSGSQRNRQCVNWGTLVFLAPLQGHRLLYTWKEQGCAVPFPCTAGTVQVSWFPGKPCDIPYRELTCLWSLLFLHENPSRNKAGLCWFGSVWLGASSCLLFKATLGLKIWSDDSTSSSWLHSCISTYNCKTSFLPYYSLRVAGVQWTVKFSVGPLLGSHLGGCLMLSALDPLLFSPPYILTISIPFLPSFPRTPSLQEKRTWCRDISC